MKLIKPSFEIIPQELGLDGVYKQIEKAGRTCYKSEDKITEDSAKKFVDMLATRHHGAMLEHGTIYLYIEYTSPFANFELYNIGSDMNTRYSRNKFSRVNIITEDHYKTKCFITTNYRVIVENNWFADLEYMCDQPMFHHDRRVTVKFITDQGILREFTRHRVFSFAVESTRYCNYNKSKFGSEITYIIPEWCTNIDSNEIYPIMDAISNKDTRTIQEREFLAALQTCETTYMQLLELGWKPQQARNVLPLATKCEMVMTGFISDWAHFFDLRCDVAAHPQARELAIPLKEEFINLNLDY